MTTFFWVSGSGDLNFKVDDNLFLSFFTVLWRSYGTLELELERHFCF